MWLELQELGLGWLLGFPTKPNVTEALRNETDSASDQESTHKSQSIITDISSYVSVCMKNYVQYHSTY